MRRNWSIILLVLLLTAGAASARRAGEQLKPGFNLFSKDQDVQVGKENADEVLKQYEVVKNQSLQDYIRGVGDRLAAAPEARDSGFKFTFTLLNVQQVNAFALPGGPMFIFTGLFKSADNEGQLAGVMAHEMSHVILRHGTHEASKSNLIEIPAKLAAAATGGSLLGQLAQAGIGLTANSFILKFSRDAESEADALGSHLMAEAGYNPIEMAHFFEKLAASGNQGPQFLSDHPNPGNRQQAIEEEIKTLPPHQYGYQTGSFDRAKAEILKIPAPPKKNTAP